MMHLMFSVCTCCAMICTQRCAGWRLCTRGSDHLVADLQISFCTCCWTALFTLSATILVALFERLISNLQFGLGSRGSARLNFRWWVVLFTPIFARDPLVSLDIFSSLPPRPSTLCPGPAARLRRVQYCCASVGCRLEKGRHTHNTHNKHNTQHTHHRCDTGDQLVALKNLRRAYPPPKRGAIREERLIGVRALPSSPSTPRLATEGNWPKG